MRTDLNHLPQIKQRELAHVVDIIREGFAKAIAHRTQERFRNGKILKIILFGSYARGDWVDDPVGRYSSDYDLLVVLSHEDLTDVPEFWVKTEDRLLDELSEGKALRTPVSLIYHSLNDVNEKLRLGRYFFIDILKKKAFFCSRSRVTPSFSPMSSARAKRSTKLGIILNAGCRMQTSFLKELIFICHVGIPIRLPLIFIRRPSGFTNAFFWSAHCTHRKPII